MKNTVAIGAIILGGILVYSGFKNWTIPETIKFFTGGEAPDIKPPNSDQLEVVPPGGLTENDLKSLEDHGVKQNGDGTITTPNGTVAPGIPIPIQPGPNGLG